MRQNKKGGGTRGAAAPRARALEGHLVIAVIEVAGGCT
jgi:hypothetical protein